ncbi:MAG: hypothetical protein GF399_12990 [Candidatus Coatesbacteria bacterium]|jgi:hypothetical protein|nr:hypothetical protein [Candidatus Coatesbacteria bacterium]
MRRFISLAVAAVVLALTGLLYAADEEDTEAVVTYVEGEVVKKPEVQETWDVAELNSVVSRGYKVRTYQLSRAELTLNTGSAVRLAPRTTVDVVKLFEESREGYNETLFNVEEGEVWANIEELGSTESFSITSDIMGAACRGTTYRVSVTGDGTTMLRVYEGAVELWDPMKAITGPGFWETGAAEGEDGDGKHEVVGPHEVAGPHEVTEEEWRRNLITSMQEVIIGADGEVLRQGSFSHSDPAEQSEWVRWNHERDAADE